MARSIVRAQDRVALWHQAADQDSVGSSPPAGETPAVVVPKSNKFLGPAKQVKKTLDAIPGDAYKHFDDHSHPAVKAVLDKYPDWSKSYLKPQHQETLKAHFGPETYGKFEFHMPQEHHDALHNVAQNPAPKSNKYTYPANHLKKLLDDPHTTSTHVDEFLNKYHGFAHTYLSQGYQHALKGSLGEKNYAELLKHLPEGHHQQLTGTPKQEQTQPPGVLQPPPEGLAEVEKGPEQPSSKPSALSEEDQKEADQLKQMVQSPQEAQGPQQTPPGVLEQYNEGDKVQQKGLTPEDLKSVFPTIGPAMTEKWLAGGDLAQQKALMEQSLKGNFASQDTKAKFQSVYDKHFGQQPQLEQELSLGQKMKAINPFINAELVDNQPPHLQKWIVQTWANDPLTDPEKKKQIQQLHDEHFGQPEAQPQEPAQQGLGDKLKEVLPPQLANNEHFINEWNNAPDDLEALAGLKGHNPQIADQLQAIYDEHHGTGGDDQDQISQIQQLLEPVYQPQAQQGLSPASQSGDVDPQHAALVAGIKKVFPDTPLDLDSMSTPELKTKLESWQEHLNPDLFDKHLTQLQALHNQHFGDGDQQPVAGTPLIDPKYQIASDIYKINPSFQLDKLQKLSPQDAEAIIKSQAAAHSGTSTGDAYQQLLDKHFGQAAPADLAQAPDLVSEIDKVFHLPAASLHVWKNKYPEKQKADIEKLVSSGKGSTGLPLPPDVHAKWKQIYDTVYGGGQQGGDVVEQPQQSLYDALNEVKPGYFGKDFWQNNKGVSDDTKKEMLQHWLKEHAGTPHEPKLQAIYDKYFGGEHQKQGDPSAYPGASFAQATGDQLGNWPGFLVDGKQPGGKFHLYPGAAAFLESKGYGLEEFKKLPYNMDYMGGNGPTQVSLAKGFDSLDPDQKAIYAEQEQQGQQGQGGGTQSYDQQPQAQPQGGGIKPLEGVSQETFTHEVPMPLMAGGYDAKPPYKWAPGVQAYLAEQGITTPADISHHKLLQFYGSWEKLSEQEKQHYIDQESGPGSPSGGQQAPQKAMTLDDWDKIQPHYKGWFWGALANKTPERQQQKLQNIVDKYNGFGELAQGAQKALDTWFGGAGGQSAPSAPPAKVTPTVEQLGQIINDHYLAGKILKGGEDNFWANVEHVKGKIAQGDPDGHYGPNDVLGCAWNKIVKWVDQNSGQPGAASFESGPPADVKDQIIKHLTDVLGWNKDAMGTKKIKNAATPEEAIAQLKNWAQGSYPNLKPLYEQLAGQGSGDQGDISAIQQQVKDLPPPEPAKPFKTEDLKPEDLQAWSANKPQNAAQWKDFTKWWGATKMSPEQEQGLYNNWFGKNASPEQAGQWFQQVFEHNSDPGPGDLGAKDIPGWAHNSWAFGKNAETEWPVFKQWATKDPGLPKGTGVKQKLQTWNGLSAAEKSEIANAYAEPQDSGVDTKAVLKDLKLAYPDSDWSKWAKMGPEQLQKSVENLAKAGYGPAVGVYNNHFGGSMDMPEEPPEGEEQKAPTHQPLTQPPPVPMDQVPPWFSSKFNSPAKAAQSYANFAQWAKSLGKEDLLEASKDLNFLSSYGSNELSKLYGQYSQLPAHLKAQLGAMDQAPWYDQEGFELWKDSQPQLKDDLKKIYPDKDFGDHYPWNSPNHHSPQIVLLKKQINKETDPAKKQALLGLYAQYHGLGKIPLAQTLKDIYPDQDWDKTLQSKSKDQVMSLLKKQLKNEKDPETWIKLVDAWNKHFPHPTKNYGPAPSGHKQVTDTLKSQAQEVGVKPNWLKALKYWKEVKGSDPWAPIGVPYGVDYDPGEYVNGQKNDTKSYLPYLGWTPPAGASSSYKVDPTFYGAPDTPKATKTYAVPAEAHSEHYKNLVDRVYRQVLPTREHAIDELDHLSQNPTSVADVQMVKHLQDKYFGHNTEFDPKKFMKDYRGAFPKSSWMSPYSAADKENVASEGFRSWFEKAPPAYKATFQHNPGIALDDYEEFMKGGQTYSKPPDAQDWNSVPVGESKSFELQHPSTTKKKNKEHVPGYKDQYQYNMWPGWTHNPEAELGTGRPDEHLPQVHFDPKNPSQLDIPLPAGQKWDTHGPQKLYRAMTIHFDKHIDKSAHPKAYKLREQIKAIVNGSDKGSNPTLDEAQMREMQRQMQETAKGWGASPEELKKMEQNFDKPTEGTYQHPDLAHLILEFLSLGGQDGGKDARGLGIHWTTNEYKGHNVPSSVSLSSHVKRTEHKLPVTISADWGGAGEDPGRSGGATGYPGEEEITLSPGAPVRVHRLELRRHDGTFEDIMNHDGRRPHLPGPHRRYASMALDPSNPEHLSGLAQQWGIRDPERYGLGQTVWSADAPKPAPAQRARDFYDDLKGSLWAQKEMAKEYALGIPNPRRQHKMADLEEQILILADLKTLPTPDWMKQHVGPAYDDPVAIEELYHENPNSWVFKQWKQDNAGQGEGYEDDEDEQEPEYDPYEEDDEDDYEDHDDEDWGGDPPGPEHFSPEGWHGTPPMIKNDPRNRRYFSPTGVNPESTSQARPDVDWGYDYPEQPFLQAPPRFGPGQEPGPGGQHQLFDVANDSGVDWPDDRPTLPLYRGDLLDLTKPELAHVRRALFGGTYEADYGQGDQHGAHGPFSNYSIAKPHPAGYDNPQLGEHILNYMQGIHGKKSGDQYDRIGRHWSTEPGNAQDFAKGTTMGGNHHPLKLPVVVRAQWKGAGEDPYRTNTAGDWPEENEITMLPGAKMNVDSVKIHNPTTKTWHEVLSQPTERHAGLIEAELAILEKEYA